MCGWALDTVVPRWLRALSWSIVLGVTAYGATVSAQSLYKYRDASGAWVYTERQPPAGTTAKTITVDLEAKAPRITVEQRVDGQQLSVLAINDCACVAEYLLRIGSPGNVALPQTTDPATYHAVLQPHAQQALLTAAFAGPTVTGFDMSWRVVLGAPGAAHQPHEPYRVPFALGASFRVSQAYPTHLTHVTADTEYAVNLVVPDGTPIYAAREGMVINVRHDFFRGAPDAAMLDQANVVQILHDDGTIAVYAHLHWQSIRVQPAQSVRRGEYIADSGNTGLSTGPHLHFAVIRNAGMRAESVPVQFAGAGGRADHAADGNAADRVLIARPGSTPLQRHKTHRMGMALVGSVRHRFALTPCRKVPQWEIDVAREQRAHAREIDPRRQRQRQRIDLGAADDTQLHGASGQCPRLLDAVDIFDAGGGSVRSAAQHQVAPARQRLADRIEGPAPHQQRLAERHGLEVLQIVGQMPWQAAVLADHAVVRHGHHQCNPRGRLRGDRIGWRHELRRLRRTASDDTRNS